MLSLRKLLDNHRKNNLVARFQKLQREMSDSQNFHPCAKLEKYIAQFMLKTNDINKIKRFIDAYCEVIGVNYTYFTRLDPSEFPTYQTVTTGTIFHLIEYSKNELARSYILQNYGKYMLPLTNTPTSFCQCDEMLAVNAYKKFTTDPKIAFLMGFHSRLGNQSTLFKMANSELGKKALENELSKVIFSYLP